MKKALLSTAFLFLVCVSYSQSGSGFGIKGGVNYTGNGDFFDSGENALESPERNIGYHLGVFGKLGGKLYIRPELMYTHTSANYNQGELQINKLDAPLLVGLNILGPLHVFAGPALQYIINTDFNEVRVNDLQEEFTIGLHLGAGVSFGKFGADIRYERGFTQNEINLINTNIAPLSGDRVDTRPDQLILSISVRL